MKKIIYVFVFITLYLQNISAQDLYSSESITLIEITFENANWDEELDDLHAAGNNDRLLATVEINAESFDSVGVRYRGGASYAAAQTKNPFNIKLDFVKNHNYDGRKLLKLNNGAKDPLFIREVLSFEVANQYMPAPQANYAKVFVNGNYHGLYVNVESITKKFMGNQFYSNKNNTFFDCSPDGTIAPPVAGCIAGKGSSLQNLGTIADCYKDYYDKPSSPATGWNELINLIQDLDQNSINIESSINMDRAIWMSAMNNLLVNLDSYLGVEPGNYFLFRDDNDRFNSMIWDLNETFGGDQKVEDGQPNLSLNELQNLDPLLRMNEETYPLLKLILQNPRYKRQYIAHFRTMLEEVIDGGWYATRAQELVNLISTDLTNDPNKLYSISDFNANLNSTVTIDYNGGMVDIPGLAELMNGRLTYLWSHSEFMKTPPVISNIGHFPIDVTANSTTTITAEITNASYVYVGYRDNLTQVFQKNEMFDDGNHNDGIAGDGIYGGDVSVGIEGVQYYIYAEDEASDVGAFSPARAEEVYYNLTTYGDVVINELMASNTMTVTDQDGEYDDWVELYNNTPTSISLDGYYLSDDPTNLTKFEFPNVIIDGNSYLIVWIDKDPDQSGLHADFKLSGNGEELLLVNANLQVVDKVVFGAQTADVSFARIPNGVGGFDFASPPTFGANNGLPDATTNFAKELGLEIYPNPADDFLILEMKNEKKMRIDLFNSFGQKIQSFELKGKKYVDVSGLGSGMYWLSWEGRFLGRVVILDSE